MAVRGACSKNSSGPHLTFPDTAWKAFLTTR
ncbi:DUF397 domain-containing protein [Alloactinosynnema sp. L-07]